jgi:hypothetical protein
MTAAAFLFACTVCDSDLGQQVRAGIFADDFYLKLAAVLAPFPLLLLAVGGVHFLSAPRS